MRDFQINFLGTRGSIPVEGSDYIKFGGATSCVWLKIANQNIVLDAGSGFLNLPARLEGNKLHLLLSHSHADHIMGLPMSNLFYNTQIEAHIYGATRYNLNIKQQINHFMQPPLWPVNSDSFLAQVCYHALEENFMIGPVEINTMEGSHPGGCSVFRLNYHDKSLVYATDYEISEDNQQKLIDFAHNCDLFICDGQYSPAEAPVKKTFGHSGWIDAGQVALAAKVKCLCIFHHDAARSDDLLEKAEQDLRYLIPHSFFARRGERISL